MSFTFLDDSKSEKKHLPKSGLYLLLIILDVMLDFAPYFI